MTAYCGMDWAEAHHDLALVDETGVVLAKLRIAMIRPASTSCSAFLLSTVIAPRTRSRSRSRPAAGCSWPA